MKIKTALFFVATMIASNVTYAGSSDDIKWIAQCLSDNQKEGASADTVQKYCSCMNNKMSESETLSISQWEKTHPTEMAACEAEAGWK
jgi:hypothetical protein